MKTTRPKSDPWDSILSLDRPKRTGLNPAQLERRNLWSQAIFCGGSTLKLWNLAVELKAALLSVCALERGQKIMLISKYAHESGIVRALESIVGTEGEILLQEIGPQALTAFPVKQPPVRTPLQWDFHNFDSLSEGSLDRVILFNSAGHIGNWEHCASQIHRILQNEGRVIVADAPWGGKELIAATRLDTHAKSMLDTLLAGIGMREADLPQTGPEDLKRFFKPCLRWSRAFCWRGLYLFYGQKTGGETYFRFPSLTEEVRDFLTEKPSSGPWDFLSSAEVDVFGKEVTDIEMQKKWGRMLTLGGSLEWMHENSSSIINLMYDNLQAKEGYRVLVIGERLETLGFLPQLRKRIGEKSEIVFFDLNQKHFEIFSRVWRKDADVPPVSERHQWEYNFADSYPDNYFDLIWLPQAVHHARSWQEAAPRLLRALRPDGQIMLLECRVCHPVFYTAMQMSALLQSIFEKTMWAMQTTFAEFPDYTTEQLAQAFGDSLKDVYFMEWQGWLVFWGYKK